MGKCRKCGKELTGIETTGWFGKLCEKCWQEQHYTQYPFKKGIDEKDKKIADLEAKLAEYQNDGVGDVIINSGKKIKELQQQLKSQPAEIVEKIRKKLCDRLNIIAGYGQMTVDEFSFFVESEFTKDICEILKEYGGKDE